MHTSGSFRKRVEIGQKQQIPHEQPAFGCLPEFESHS